MSIRIIKEGSLDTIQKIGGFRTEDEGPWNGGPADVHAAALANALLGLAEDATVLEMHFPAAQLMFDKVSLICITGADFDARMNNEPVPLNHPILVNAHCLLHFTKPVRGLRVYVAVANGLAEKKHEPEQIVPFERLSYNPKLLRYDSIALTSKLRLPRLHEDECFRVLPWQVAEARLDPHDVRFIIGTHWHDLATRAREAFQTAWFQVLPDADRRALRLKGKIPIEADRMKRHPIGISAGTILLTGGNLQIALADGPETSADPVVAHVISADLSIVAQSKPGDVLRFVATELGTAEDLIIAQHHYLNEVRAASEYRIAEFLATF